MACCAAKGQTEAVHSVPGMRVPVVTVTKDDPRTSPGMIFLTPRARLGVKTGPMILDAHGRVVWFQPMLRRATLGLNVQTYRGQRVLTWAQRPPIRTDADLYNGNPHSLYNVIADSRYRVIKRVRARGEGVRTDMHDFVITRRNTAYVLGFRYLPRRLHRRGFPERGRIIDCLVQEVDIATNRVLFSWSAARHVSLRDSYATPLKSGDWDWFHVNSVSIDIDGNLLVTARHTSAVYKISRRTGRVIWTLGGRNSTFRMGNGTHFSYEHDAQRSADGTITIFDNHGTEFHKRPGSTTRVLRLRLSTRKRTATLVRSYAHPKGAVLATSQGDARVLADGNVFVGWGNSPWWSEHAPDGTPLFVAHLPSITYQSYRVLKGDWHARPSGGPAVLAVKSAGSVIVYASWNGTTDIVAWRVLAGPSASALQEIGTAGWAGFETKMRFATDQRLVQVQALDVSGSVMGSSNVVSAK